MRRRTMLGALPAAIALARPAIAQGTAARTLRFVPQANLTSPDPIWTTANVTRNHAHMVWDTFYGQDTALRPQPKMRVGHELSDDQLTWRFTLREGLMFHDGTPVRAADWIVSITRWSKRDTFGQLIWARLAEMRALDEWLDAPDLPTQRKIAEVIQRVVWDEVPYIPVGQWSLPIAYRAAVTGVLRSPYPTFWNVSKS